MTPQTTIMTSQGDLWPSSGDMGIIRILSTRYGSWVLGHDQERKPMALGPKGIF
jgi:hypothetical protein